MKNVNVNKLFKVEEKQQIAVEWERRQAILFW